MPQPHERQALDAAERAAQWQGSSYTGRTCSEHTSELDRGRPLKATAYEVEPTEEGLWIDLPRAELSAHSLGREEPQAAVYEGQTADRARSMLMEERRKQVWRRGLTSSGVAEDAELGTQTRVPVDTQLSAISRRPADRGSPIGDTSDWRNRSASRTSSRSMPENQLRESNDMHPEVVNNLFEVFTRRLEQLDTELRQLKSSKVDLGSRVSVLESKDFVELGALRQLYGRVSIAESHLNAQNTMEAATGSRLAAAESKELGYNSQLWKLEQRMTDMESMSVGQHPAKDFVENGQLRRLGERLYQLESELATQQTGKAAVAASEAHRLAATAKLAAKADAEMGLVFAVDQQGLGGSEDERQWAAEANLCQLCADPLTGQVKADALPTAVESKDHPADIWEKVLALEAMVEDLGAARQLGEPSSVMNSKRAGQTPNEAELIHCEEGVVQPQMLPHTHLTRQQRAESAKEFAAQFAQLQEKAAPAVQLGHQMGKKPGHKKKVAGEYDNDAAGAHDNEAGNPTDRGLQGQPGSRHMSDEEVNDHCDHHMQHHSVHEIAETIWEATMLVFLPGMRRWDVMMTVGTYCLNLAMQAVFLFAMYTSFLEGSLPAIEDIHRWRAAEGHQVHATDGPSWVARICGQDFLLGMHQDKMGLLRGLADYRRYSAGFFLAIAVLLVWTFSITGEVRQCISFGRALFHLPVGELLVRHNVNGKLKLVSINRKCMTVMMTITVVRSIMAVALGYVGAFWLVQETNIENLILNAGALAFVLQVDEVLFEEVGSRRVIAILGQLAPLEKSVRKKPAYLSLLEFVHIFVLGCAFCFVGVMSAVYLLSMREQMTGITTAMCQEPQDFNIGRHKAGLFMAAPTRPFSSSSLPNVEEDGEFHVVGTVLRQGELTLTEEVSPVEDSLALREWLALPVGTLLHRWTTAATDPCADHGGAFSGVGDLIWLQFAASLRIELGNESLSSCQDVSRYCGEEDRYLVRALCPSTCGCALPRSGLHTRGPESGCPFWACSATPAYQAALTGLACKDEPKETLAQLQEWSWLSEQTFARFGKWFYFGEAELDAAKSSMVSEGCEYLRALPLVQVKLWCRGHDYSGTGVVEFCPEACDCTSDFVSACPLACAPP